MKIYMQVPWTDTEFASAASRKAQADINRSDSMASEIKALRLLTENGSTHTPLLISDFHTTQDNDGIVPTGFISYILMTWCPGVTLGDGDYRRKTKSEQARIFQAFREALEDTKRCGVVSNGLGPGNLIWDAAHNKCYMVDFKWSGPPSEWDIAEEVWMSWGLQPGPPRLEMERL
ncbi:hypothetical protein DTO166G4_8191 [Paecilomyces variotii]|nr:hypothetical protein DTO032I3_8013 [Paecilomyces variotii]KAJ9207360.1 hypothetical protein DTO164E3_634 [Paecilomyces variotii]KAJ9210179.1 hypothetical protein DTO166G4_8191 [Paecilomyces variotii]KAJ9221883.1 hypothetical protein DTO169C6_5846 [Paecilomyces variotii]KAJ9241728.1 hypothetical protein DTO169E5_3472 [Paecilomyces variotii]